MTYQESSLRSIYRSISHQSSTYRQNSSFQQITPGICDYIPISLFNKQFLSILIQGDSKQIIHNILWNQFYSKTLLKQICQNISKNKTNQSVLMNVWNKKQQTFIKTGNSIFNAKDKLQYENAQLIEDKIIQSKQLLIQTFSDQGNWKKINIEIGPYKDRKFYDVVFVLKNQITNQQVKQPKQSINRKSLKGKVPQSAKKINSDKKSSKSNYVKTIQKDFNSTKKKNNSSLTQSTNKILNKQNSNQKEKSQKIIKFNNLVTNTVKTQNKVKPQRKVSISSLSNALKQTNSNANNNWNNTQKLSIKQRLNFDQYLPIQSCIQSLSMKRKNASQKKQTYELFDPSSQIKKSIQNQNSKTSCVLTQIIQKKDRIISSQVKKIEQIQDAYENQIQEIRVYSQQKVKGLQQQLKKALFQNQSNKVKFCSQNQSLNQIINNIKQSLQRKEASYDILQQKFKEVIRTNQDQSDQISLMKAKQQQINVKYQKLLIQSKQEAMCLFKQLTNLRQQKQNIQKRYKNLMQKVKVLTQQQ